MGECETCILISIELGTDDAGFPKEIETRTEELYCSEKSVNYREYYDAIRTNINPKIILVLRVEDWELSAHIVNSKKEYASKVEYDGCVYDVVRSFTSEKDPAHIEVTLA